jgi:hypothetical protein
MSLNYEITGNPYNGLLAGASFLRAERRGIRDVCRDDIAKIVDIMQHIAKNRVV